MTTYSFIEWNIFDKTNPFFTAGSSTTYWYSIHLLEYYNQTANSNVIYSPSFIFTPVQSTDNTWVHELERGLTYYPILGYNVNSYFYNKYYLSYIFSLAIGKNKINKAYYYLKEEIVPIYSSNTNNNKNTPTSVFSSCYTGSSGDYSCEAGKVGATNITKQVLLLIFRRPYNPTICPLAGKWNLIKILWQVDGISSVTGTTSSGDSVAVNLVTKNQSTIDCLFDKYKSVVGSEIIPYSISQEFESNYDLINNANFQNPFASKI